MNWAAWTNWLPSNHRKKNWMENVQVDHRRLAMFHCSLCTWIFHEETSIWSWGFSSQIRLNTSPKFWIKLPAELLRYRKKIFKKLSSSTSRDSAVRQTTTYRQSWRYFGTFAKVTHMLMIILSNSKQNNIVLFVQYGIGIKDLSVKGIYHDIFHLLKRWCPKNTVFNH